MVNRFQVENDDNFLSSINLSAKSNLILDFENFYNYLERWMLTWNNAAIQKGASLYFPISIQRMDRNIFILFCWIRYLNNLKICSEIWSFVNDQKRSRNEKTLLSRSAYSSWLAKNACMPNCIGHFVRNLKKETICIFSHRSDFNNFSQLGYFCNIFSF